MLQQLFQDFVFFDNKISESIQWNNSLWARVGRNIKSQNQTLQNVDVIIIIIYNKYKIRMCIIFKWEKEEMQKTKSQKHYKNYKWDL